MFRIEHNLETGETKKIPLTQEELSAIEATKPTLEQRNLEIKKQRELRYNSETDPLGMQYLRTQDEGIKQQWLDGIAKIKLELPYEVE